MPETLYDELIRHVTLGGVIAILLFLFKQNNIYKMIKERVNIMWREYCRAHNIPYNALGDDDLMDIKNGNGGK